MANYLQCFKLVEKVHYELLPALSTGYNHYIEILPKVLENKTLSEIRQLIAHIQENTREKGESDAKKLLDSHADFIEEINQLIEKEVEKAYEMITKKYKEVLESYLVLLKAIDEESVPAGDILNEIKQLANSAVTFINHDFQAFLNKYKEILKDKKEEIKSVKEHLARFIFEKEWSFECRKEVIWHRLPSKYLTTHEWGK